MAEEETEKVDEEKSGMPVKQEMFLEAGMHIGTKIRTNDMRDFVFKRRDDGLFILDLRKSAERLMSAAKMISQFRPEDVLVVASRVYSSNPATKFSQLTSIPLVKGRFVPGTMTNMMCASFKEPKLVMVCDPKGEREAILESAKNGVPVIALCDTDNETKFIDLIVPINNKGKRSLALTFYILARELMLSQGKIKDYSEFPFEVHHFEQPPPEKKEEAKAEEAVEAAKEEAAKEEAEKEEKAAKDKEEEKKAEEALKVAKDEKESKEKPKKEEKPEKKAEEKKEAAKEEKLAKEDASEEKKE
ncbi:MAG: 30S ribosomal protein S2 [Candidatus Micrarchaeota archaeon]